ncbi:TetR/AcrR family transcriptional regulator [Aliihoeflea sp. PC F10.4]
MRGLAAHLGVTPMALYNHVGDRADLLRMIAGKVIDAIEFDREGANWRGRIEHCFSMLRAACGRHPELMREMQATNVAPASIFAPMNVTLSALGQAGMNEIDALRVYFMLVHFTLGQAGYEHRAPITEMDPRVKARSPGASYEAVDRLDLPETWDFDAAFELGLRVVLDGVEAQL